MYPSFNTILSTIRTSCTEAKKMTNMNSPFKNYVNSCPDFLCDKAFTNRDPSINFCCREKDVLLEASLTRWQFRHVSWPVSWHAQTDGKSKPWQWTNGIRRWNDTNISSQSEKYVMATHFNKGAVFLIKAHWVKTLTYFGAFHKRVSNYQAK